jgi:hypothetical protein
LALCFAPPTLAQNAKNKARDVRAKAHEAQDARDAKTKEMLEKARKNGRPLRINVNGNVSAAAVLIPQVDARRIFGKEIANNYAVIEVNVGNKSPDAALIIHDIFIDYSRWALSGSTEMSAPTVEGLARDPLAPFQASTSPNRVASEEYRVVRGQLLDAQMSTKRNRIIKWLALAGTVAAAYTFSINEEGFIRGIAAYNGVVVPGIGATFPDAVIPQLNRISDFGFQTNKVIPKEGGEVIVCFFPIDRFLTPGFRTLFLKSPALFFAPLQMLVDDTVKGDVDKALGEDLGLSAADIGANPGEVRKLLRRQLPCYLRMVKESISGQSPRDNTFLGQINRNADVTCLAAFGLEEVTDAAGRPTGKIQLTGGANGTLKAESEKRFATFLALDYLSQASLNNVKVTIDGVMTVDITSIAAKVDDVTFDGTEGCAPNQECFWTVPADGSGAVRTGTIDGAYLTNGNVVIAETDLGIEEVKAIPEGSSDQALRFSFKLTMDVPSGKNLTFKVTKARPDVGSTIDSQPWIYTVGFLSGTATLGKAAFDAADSTLTLPVLGPKFTDAEFKRLTFALETPGMEMVTTDLKQKQEGGNIVLSLPANADRGCWSVKVKRGGNDVRILKNTFEVPPSPTLTSATVKDGVIVVVGTDLIDTDGCDGKPLSFQMVEKKDDGTGKTLDLEVEDGTLSATGASLTLPDEAGSGTWVVQVRRGNDAATKAAQQEITIP